VHRRLECVQRLTHVDFDVYCLPCYNFSPLLKFIFQCMRKPYKDLPIYLKMQNITYRYIHLKDTTAVFLMQKLAPSFNSTIEARYTRVLIDNFSLHDLDFIHAHGMYEVAAGNVARLISERTGVPYVITLHGSDVNIVMRKRSATYVRTLENASKCIFVSNALLEKAENFGYSGRNGIVIPNGYDPNIFYPLDKDTVRKNLGVYRPNLKYVGFVGNLNKVKRADKLPSIFWEIQKRVQDVTFIVVGDGPLRKKVELDTAGLNVVFTGRIPQEEVAKWMNVMDIMVLPSRNEGFPTVAVEAAACGTPVIGSSNGGIPEAVGFEELVVTEGSDFEKRFAKKVIDILSMNKSDLELLRTKVRARAQNFTWERIVLEEMKVYKEILKEQ